MLRLSLPQSPYWIDAGYEVQFKVRPCSSAIFYQARAFMNEQLAQQAPQSDAQETISELKDRYAREALAEFCLTRGLARAGIIEWKGVLNAKGDQCAALSDANIDSLFSDYWMIAESFRQQYTGLQELLESEKKALRPVSDGTLQTGRAIVSTVPNEANPAPKVKKGATGERCPYYEHSLKTLEGWQAWDVACKLMTSSQECFPLETALHLSASLGYEPQAMAQLLPEVALGRALALQDRGEHHGSE